MARGEPPDRNERSAETGAARTWRSERLAGIPGDSPTTTAEPLRRTLDQLATLAMIRGDAAEQSLFTHAAAFVQARNIQSDLDVGSLIESPPADCDPEILRRLRQMYEAGGWVLVESAIADLPADLRWLYESGAVTIEQLGALHVGLGATSGTDLAAAVAEHRIKSLPGLDAAAEEAIAAALPGLRTHIPRIALGRAVAIVEPILEHLREVTGVAWALPAGSLRRGQDMVGDIEIV
ncbi:MAG TPA: hypothetical protein VGG73_23130, partial [Vicinamibacterales bacterium]